MIDHTGLQVQTRRMYIEEVISGCTIDIATTLGEVLMAYKKELFDLVIIDHTIENGIKCVEYILEHDPEQKILVVSDAIRCVITRCEDCVNEHNIRRLSNPTPIRNIARMVGGFNSYKCDHYDPETNKITPLN
jgi:ActR/RegA family two-component response regulator